MWFSLKRLRCRAKALSSLHGYALESAIFTSRHTDDRCACACAVLFTRVIFCEKTSGVRELVFVLIMPPSNVCPQCQAVVPPQGKTQKVQAPRGLALQCFLVNPRRTCAARVTVLGLSVSQCVCSRLFSHCRQRSGIRAIPTAPAQQAIEK